MRLGAQCVNCNPSQTKGRDLALSIDVDLQNFAAQRLNGHSGSAMVMDIHNGEMVTMVSSLFLT